MRHIRFYAVLATVSFLLHFVWERAHIILYTGYEALEGVLPVYLYATAGDVMYTCAAMGIFTLITRGRERAPRDYLWLAGIGFFIAVSVEVKAHMLGRWAYTDAMPLVQGLGLSPLVQMTVLLPLSVYITTVVLTRLTR